MTGTIKKLGLVAWVVAAIAFALLPLLCLSGCHSGGGVGDGLASTGVAAGPALPFVITEFESLASVSMSTSSPTLIESVNQVQPIESRAATTPESSSGHALPLTEQQQPKDGAARDFSTQDPKDKAINDLTVALSLKANDLELAQATHAEDLKRIKELETIIAEMTSKRIAELDERLKAERAAEQAEIDAGSQAVAGQSVPQVFVGSTESCFYCQVWKKSKSPNSIFPLRFVDVEKSKPADVPQADWDLALANIKANGGVVPFVWWRSKIGGFRFLIGRYSDSQLEWSIREADRLDAEAMQRQQPPAQNHRPKMIRPAVALSGVLSSTALQSSEATR